MANKKKPMALAIDVPAGYRPIAECIDLDRDVTLVHASLNARASEMATLLAVRDALAGHEALVLTEQRSRCCHLAYEWLDKAGLIKAKRVFDGVTLFDMRGGANLWIAMRKVLEDPPFAGVDRMYVVGADRDFGKEVLDLPRRLSVACFGELPEAGHWFDELTRRRGVWHFRMNAEDVCAMFPDQRDKVLAQNDPLYERAMLLKDVKPRYDVVSFISFARRRLKIRTDKPLSVLLPQQREEAASQHGVPIVSLLMHPSHKRYLAHKRLAAMKRRMPWFLVLKSRRIGITSIEQALSYQVAVTQPNSYVATLAHRQDFTMRVFNIAKLYADRDPNAPEVLGESRTQLQFGNGSRFFIGTAGGKTFGRGDSLQRGHGSEVAFWCPGPEQNNDIDNLVAGLMGACSNGEIVLETTANGQNWFFHKWAEAVAGGNAFTPIFLPWFEDPMNRLAEGSFDKKETREVMSPMDVALMTKHRLDLSQMAFIAKMRQQYGPLCPQEYPADDAEAFLSIGMCFFDAHVVTRLQKLRPMPIETKTLPGGTERIWFRPTAGHRYAIGVDTSEGVLGGDSGVAAVLDLTTGEQAACLRGHFSPTLLADHVARLHNVYPGIVAVERESFGYTTITRLGDLGISRPHYFGGPLFHYARDKKGWSTNEQTRGQALESLREAIITEGADKRMKDMIMLAECLSFRLQSSGKFEADSGAHDDSVMAWALAHSMSRAVVARPGIHLVGGDDDFDEERRKAAEIRRFAE